MAKTANTLKKNKLGPHKVPKPLLWVLILAFLVIGIILIRQIFAASVPVFRDNAEYWRPRIAQCESGSNYTNAKNPNYRGAYQYAFSTWGNYKGYYDPVTAPPEVQDERFYLSFAKAGTAPWSSSYSCWIKGANVPGVADDSAGSLPNAGQVVATVATPPPNPFGITSGSYNVLVSGRLTVDGSPLPNVVLATCSGDRNTTTDAEGRFGFGIPVNNAFCLRPSSGLPGDVRLERTNNNVEHAEASTYEQQRAGVNCYHSVWCLLSEAYTWDRKVDNGYNFFYTRNPQ